jgi:hypothetical protein
MAPNFAILFNYFYLLKGIDLLMASSCPRSSSPKKKENSASINYYSSVHPMLNVYSFFEKILLQLRKSKSWMCF